MLVQALLYEQNAVQSRAFINCWRTIKPLVQVLSLCTNMRATMQSVTDRKTDRIHDDVNSQSDCVAVRWAKKYHFNMLNVTLVLDIFCRYIVHRIQTHVHVALVFSYVASLLI